MSRSSENLTISATLNQIVERVTRIVQDPDFNDEAKAVQVSQVIHSALQENHPPRPDIWEAAVLNAVARLISSDVLCQQIAQAIGIPEFAGLGEHEGQTHENYPRK